MCWRTLSKTQCSLLMASEADMIVDDEVWVHVLVIYESVRITGWRRKIMYVPV